ncbi:MAG: VWA domain-containing protein [Candidatus Melainabacteria bacterium]|nr:VWA domain-containing protein [Candidatus Melainabacteria bacterium]
MGCLLACAGAARECTEGGNITMWSITKRARKQTGAAFAVLVTVSSVLIVGALGLLAAEIVRANMARQELTAVCNAAALAGATAMASYNPPNGNFDESYASDAKAKAAEAAARSFQGNSIMGVSLTSAAVSTGEDLQLTDGQVAEARVEFVAQGTGTAVKITGAVNLTPMSGAFLSIGVSTLTANSTATIPKLDVVFAMHVSGDLDDDTLAQLLQTWTETKTEESTSSTTSTQNTYAIACEGMPEDWAPAPQEKSGEVITTTTTTTTTTVPMAKEISPIKPIRDLIKPANGYSPLRLCDYGLYNFNGKLAADPSLGEQAASDYTTLVVVGPDADGDQQPDNTAAKDAWVSYGMNSQQYRSEVSKCLQPWNDVFAACNNFFSIFKTNSDAHFGLVTYERSVGTTKDSKVQYNATSDESEYPKSSTKTAYDLPAIALDSANNNYDVISESLSKLRPLVDEVGSNGEEGTSIAGTLANCIAQLSPDSVRQGAKKAIVLFTAGVDSQGDVAAQASAANSAGIPIYTIGLAHRAELKADMEAQLRTISSAAGHGGTYYVVTDAKQLNAVFENIARSLVSQAQLAEAK